MATLQSLYNDIEQLLQSNDQQAIDQFIQWFRTRTRSNETNPSASNFSCTCGHRYSLRWSIVQLSNSHESKQSTIDDAQRMKRCPNGNSSTAKLFICTHCQIRLHTRETFLQHYTMHQQGYTFCKRCFQFHHDRNGPHQCSIGKDEPTQPRMNLTQSEEKKLSGIPESKFDELHSLEQLIPPDTAEQTDSAPIVVNDQESSSAARLTRFGLPALTDSVVEVIQPDGKRQFRCPLCLNSYVNRSGLNRHYITHSSQDLWKVGWYLIHHLDCKSPTMLLIVECQFCGKRYSRKDSLKHHMKTQHAQYLYNAPMWNEKYPSLSSDDPLELDQNESPPSNSSISEDKQTIDPDEIVLIT